MLRVDCNQQPPEEAAALIRDRLMTFSASSKGAVLRRQELLAAFESTNLALRGAQETL